MAKNKNFLYVIQTFAALPQAKNSRMACLQARQAAAMVTVKMPYTHWYAQAAFFGHIAAIWRRNAALQNNKTAKAQAALVALQYGNAARLLRGYMRGAVQGGFIGFAKPMPPSRLP